MPAESEGEMRPGAIYDIRENSFQRSGERHAKYKIRETVDSALTNHMSRYDGHTYRGKDYSILHLG